MRGVIHNQQLLVGIRVYKNSLDSVSINFYESLERDLSNCQDKSVCQFGHYYRCVASLESLPNLSMITMHAGNQPWLPSV